MKAPDLSVIIPTKNRGLRLLSTLNALSQQEDLNSFEVVVADNGSSDDTVELLEQAARQLPIRVIPVSKPVGGPAAARNAAVRESNGELLLLLGDDVEPVSTDLVSQHIALHKGRDDPHFAVLGKIVWDPSKEVSDFMNWLDTGGPQFHFAGLQPGPVSASHFFYSSHLSLSRDTLISSGGFDERFPYAALEDTELGTRLASAGLELIYHPELVVLHDHPTTLDSSLSRMNRVGQSAALFNQISPQRCSRSISSPSRLKQFIAKPGARPLSGLSRIPFPVRIRRRIWHYTHMCHFIQGFREGPPEHAPSRE